MQLGFLCFEVSDPSAWHAFMTEVLGLHAVGGGRYQMDGHAWRFQIHEGPADDLVTVGWELEAPDLDRVSQQLTAGGVSLEEGDPADRGVERRLLCRDPAGVPLELVCGAARAAEPFESPLVSSGFVADGLGLGHLVLTAPNPRASRLFYTELMDFRFSDRIVCEIHGYPVDLSFFHANARHHSLAFGGPQRKRLHHFMLEVANMDDVGLIWDRTLSAGMRVTQTLGRHPNDRMFSFYARTPSGFEFELGHGGRLIDTQDWQPTTYDRISEWGHHPPQLAFRRPR